MWRPWERSSLVVAALLLLKLSNSLVQTEDNQYNIDQLTDLRLNNPSVLCIYVQCQPTDTKCPDGTYWTENVAMYGCCGGCVQFVGINNDRDCTGTIDPLFADHDGDGYCDDTDGDGELDCPEYSFRKSNSFGSSFKSSLRASSANDEIIESSWCEYGLQCFKTGCALPSTDSNPTKSCSEVYKALEDYTNSDYHDYLRDDYLWLPECNRLGQYQPKQCKGPDDDQRCVCVDPNGNTIYGAAFPFQEELFETMNCECSRRIWEQKQMGIESPTLHCVENGNYEPLQCEDGYCYCIDPNTTLTYGPTVPEKAMFILPCYNKTLLGDEGQFLRICDSKYHAHTSLRNFMVDKGYTQAPLSALSCDPDGSFSGMQCDGSGCKCKDKLGKYANNIVISTPKDGLGSGCNCRRDEALLESLHQKRTLQCRGERGGYFKYHSDLNGAYCVDGNGIRSGSKVKPQFCYKLGCGAAEFCQGGTGLDLDAQMCRDACIDCPPCVYVSYEGEDMSECEGQEGSEKDNLPCTDLYYGNE